jgi:hypothetical protein
VNVLQTVSVRPEKPSQAAREPAHVLCPLVSGARSSQSQDVLDIATPT